jgi:hypothetical protein
MTATDSLTRAVNVAVNGYIHQQRRPLHACA